MSEQLTPRVLYLTRADWGADPRHARLGGPEAGYALVPRDKRVYNIVHHTVGIDADATVNVWETGAEVKAMMRRLQVVRLDLGADVPYNFVLFLMADQSVIVCEGRGYDRSGAHTAGADGRSPYPYNYFNVSGIATSFAGNFEDYAQDLAPWLPAINDWWAHLAGTFSNIGSLTVCAGTTCGHRDYSRYSGLNATACPGQHLYRRLRDFILKEEDTMASTEYEELRREIAALRAGTQAGLAAVGSAITAVKGWIWEHAAQSGVGVPPGLVERVTELEEKIAEAGAALGG